MNYGMYNQAYLEKANNYIVITAPTEKAILLATLKSWLRIPVADVSEDTILDLLVLQAVGCFEAISRRTLMNTEFKTFRTCWFQFYELRKSILVSIEEVSYNDEDESPVIVDSTNYYSNLEDAYSNIIFTDLFTFPAKSDRADSIQISFTAGLAALTENVPADIQMALMEHVAFLYENRGDCACDDITSVPASAMKIYRSYKIEELGC